MHEKLLFKDVIFPTDCSSLHNSIFQIQHKHLTYYLGRIFFFFTVTLNIQKSWEEKNQINKLHI